MADQELLVVNPTCYADELMCQAVCEIPSSFTSKCDLNSRPPEGGATRNCGQKPC